jgi:photosystem II stability/assembly factor-like uncharacterized protein
MNKYNVSIIILLFLLPENLSAQDSTDQKFNYRQSVANYLQQSNNNEQYQKNVFPLGYGTNHLNKVTTGTGVWTELNPRVPRVDYLGIHFVNPDTGWAVGAEGAIIYSINGGIEWLTANSPTSDVLLNVHSFNGRVVVASGYNGTIVRSSDGGITWQLINSGVIGNLWEIKMINDTLGWVCGTGPSLLRTTDGGENWDLINTGYNGFNYWAFDYLNENILYVAGSGGNILKTLDGGNSWQLLQTGYLESLYRIVVFDSLRIVTGGQNAKAFNTLDGGVTWNYTLTTPEIDAMAFANDSVGYIAGYSSNSFIYKTTDGGISWQPQTAYPGGYWLMFVNDSIGFNVGLDLVVKKTTNQGISWSQLIFNDNLIDVWFESENLGWVLSANKIMKTTDSGNTWNTVIIPGSQTITGLSTIYFIDSLVGFVGAGRNRIFKTINGGNTWQRKNVFGTQDSSLWTSDFFFINNNTGWASTLNGDILKTTDGGENWLVQLQQLEIDGFTSIYFIDSLNGWTTGRYIWQTTNGGINWIKRMDIPTIYLDDVFFKDLQTGWYTSFNRLYSTNDGGNSWYQISNVNGFNYGFFNWATGQNGFITGTKTYYTSDSGSTWIDITSDIGFEVYKMHSGNDYSGYAVGDLGLIVKYIDTTIVPVELTSFTFDIEENNVELQWITQTELNNKGFDIERKRYEGIFEKIGFVEGNGTSSESHTYIYQDKNLSVGNYQYRLKQIDFNGSYKYSEIIEVNVNTLLRFSLSQNYPNPFNPYTNIVFTVRDKQEVLLKVFNTLGEEVEVLFNGIAEPGKEHKVVFYGDHLPSGVYYYSIIQGDNRINKKMILLK